VKTDTNHTRCRGLALPALAVIAAFLIGPGCASDPGPTDRPPRFTGLDKAERSVRAGQDPQTPGSTTQSGNRGAIVASVQGRVLTWDDLTPMLAEAAGGIVLEELTLDRLLREEFARRGLEIDAAAVAAERDRLLQSLSAVEDSPVDTERLLDTMRRSRGLGPVRFEALLRRSAMLRRLIANEVVVSDDAIEMAFEQAYGKHFQTRLITVPTLTEAQDIRRTLDQQAVPFGELAARRSTDASAGRGGLLEPISPADPSYPAPIRSILTQLEVGRVSPVVAIDGGYAILKLEQVIPASGVDLGSVRDEMNRRVRLQQERLLMDQLARRLLQSASITTHDPSLGWSWSARTGR
jgi:parvulin-like peptidyl-prolyl isomerase